MLKNQLTVKQRLFCEYYLGECISNATQSAIKAGYSEKTARFIGCQNLKKQNIKEYISKLSNKLIEKTRKNHFMTIKAIETIAFSNIQDLYDEKGNLKKISDLPQDVAFTIASIQKMMQKNGEEWDTVYNIKLVDKVKALNMLAKYQKLYEDQVNSDVTIKIGFEN